MSELQFKCSCADDNENDCYACQFAMDPEFCICSVYNRCEFCEFRGPFISTLADAERAFQKEKCLQEKFENNYAKWLNTVENLSYMKSPGESPHGQMCACRDCFKQWVWMYYQMGGYQQEVEEVSQWYRLWLANDPKHRDLNEWNYSEVWKLIWNLSVA